MNEGPGMVLVIGGTGMLRPMVHELVSSGATVLVVARRPSQGAPVKPSTGRFIPVTADWARPEQLTDAILLASGGRQVATAVLWIHSPYRSAVLQELKRAIAEMATVIQVRGSAGPNVADKWDRERHILAGRDVRDVVLGHHRDKAGCRWLTDHEISQGVFRALVNDAQLQIVGSIDA